MKKYSYLLATIIFLVVPSCKKDYLDRKPLTDLTVANAINNDLDAEKAIKGVYGVLRQQNLYGGNYLKFMETSSDDFTNWEPGGDTPLDDLRANALDTRFQDFWLSCYDGIQRANFLLPSFESSPDLSAETKTVGRAEVLFLRAYYYWMLVTVYGEVPIYTSLPTSFEDVFKRQSPINEVYTQIENDLKEAIKAPLPNTWSGVNIGRVTKFAAHAMLGKVYLYQKKYDLAKVEFEEVFTSSHQLNPNYGANFKLESENGIESIFEIQNYSGIAAPPAGVYFSDGGISGANNFRAVLMGVRNLNGTLKQGEIVATRDLFNEFEPNDLRLRETLWLMTCDTVIKIGRVNPVLACQCEDSIYNGKVLEPYSKGLWAVVVRSGDDRTKLGYHFHTRKGLPGANQIGIPSDDGSNIPVIRLADVYLMYAEAAAESGDLGNAITYLNKVRTRAKLDNFPYTAKYGGHQFEDFVASATLTYPWLPYDGRTVTYASNLDDFRKALVHERRVELAAEYTRWNDLVRWSYIPGHPGSALEVFKKSGNPVEQTLRIDIKDFTERNRFFPKSQIEVDKSRGTLTQSPGY